MAYKDALFQLGMDLTRSSTAQEEDHGETARSVARDVVPAAGSNLSRLEQPKRIPEVGRFQDRLASGFAGSHLIIDMFGANRLDDAVHIERTLRRCADQAGAEVRHVHLNSGTPDGVSGFAAISGGHITIHTHPETGSAVLDLLVRGDVKSARVVDVLGRAFSASRVVVREHTRGDEQQAVAQAGMAVARVPQRSRTKVRKAA